MQLRSQIGLADKSLADLIRGSDSLDGVGNIIYQYCFTSNSEFRTEQNLRKLHGEVEGEFKTHLAVPDSRVGKRAAYVLAEIEKAL